MNRQPTLSNQKTFLFLVVIFVLSFICSSVNAKEKIQTTEVLDQIGAQTTGGQKVNAKDTYAPGLAKPEMLDNNSQKPADPQAVEVVNLNPGQVVHDAKINLLNDLKTSPNPEEEAVEIIQNHFVETFHEAPTSNIQNYSYSTNTSNPQSPDFNADAPQVDANGVNANEITNVTTSSNASFFEKGNGSSSSSSTSSTKQVVSQFKEVNSVSSSNSGNAASNTQNISANMFNIGGANQSNTANVANN